LKKKQRVGQFRYKFDPKILHHWCFDDCPKNELFACWHYEYLRDCPSVIDRVLEWRRDHKDYLDLTHTREYYLRDPYELFIPQWPQDPYLKIPLELRCLHRRIRNLLFEPGIIAAIRSRKKEKAYFQIPDWSLSDTQLTQSFRKWLKQNRPRDRSGEPLQPIRQTRGR
jgi:hypothetical protein